MVSVGPDFSWAGDGPAIKRPLRVECFDFQAGTRAYDGQAEKAGATTVPKNVNILKLERFWSELPSQFLGPSPCCNTRLPPTLSLRGMGSPILCRSCSPRNFWRRSSPTSG